MRNKSLREARSGFCKHAQRYTAGKTLAEAWTKCPYGSWLKMWLTSHREVSLAHLSNLLRTKDCYVNIFEISKDWDRATQRKAARVIREHFSYTGKQLKQF